MNQSEFGTRVKVASLGNRTSEDDRRPNGYEVGQSHQDNVLPLGNIFVSDSAFGNEWDTYPCLNVE
jgi:hypothetical protein